MKLDDSIDTVKNIGTQRQNKLNKMGIISVENLLEYFPRDYEDRTNVVTVSQAQVGQEVTLKARIMNIPQTMALGKITVTKALAEDDTGKIEIVWFNQPYMRKSIRLREYYVFSGRVCEKYGRKQLNSPEYQLLNGNVLSGGRIVPVYKLPDKLSQKVFREIMKSTLDEARELIEEFLPEKIIRKYGLCSRAFAVENIHFPKDNNSYFEARRRLVFDELFILQFKLFQIKGVFRSEPSNIEISDFSLDIINHFRFGLTNAQKRVINDILNDFRKKSVMNRLIQGDVGSGKTAVAMVCAYVMAKNGYQTALMAPTDVLAFQHYESFNEVFSSLGIKCVFLSGSVKKKAKNMIYDQIATGLADIVIGTHAIIQDAVEFNRLGLVITDEQHRFGVNQRLKLTQKGEKPHTLVMTATPIPRTLALILYGDLDISVIDEMPPGRQKVDTYFVDSSYHTRLCRFIKKHIDEGRQAYIICPMIEETENKSLKSVIKYTENLAENEFNDYRVECIHGKMKADIKQDIMDRFALGEIDIMVSTTVIEVGINVPNAVIMLVENADRFGLSQLHQLRGRVGRGEHKSYCILVSDNKSSQTIERLRIMTHTNDGFEISEKDLKLRGPGDFFGTRQHGLPEMKIANLYTQKDINMLGCVQECAREVFEDDRELKKAENARLSAKIRKVFENNDIPL